MTFYVDDVIVYSKTEQDHLTHLWKIFEKFRHTGLKLKPSKCDFFKLHIEHLGHLISGTGFYPLKQQIQTILDLAPPFNVTQVRHILGLASYYRKFIPMFSLTVSPITSLTKNIPFVWAASCQTALNTIKHVLTNSPALINPDPNKQYHLFTDASNHTWSSVLTQKKGNFNGKWEVRHYLSPHHVPIRNIHFKPS